MKVTPTIDELAMYGFAPPQTYNQAVPSGTRTYIDPNEGYERTFEDAQALWDRFQSMGITGPAVNELGVIKAAAEQAGIPFQQAYEYRSATSGPLKDRNAHLFEDMDPAAIQAFTAAFGGGIEPYRTSNQGAGGLFAGAADLAGRAIGSAAENVIEPVGEFARDNPAVLFAAPLALAAAGGYFGAGGAGALGGKSGSTATQLASSTGTKATLGVKAGTAAGTGAGTAAGATAASTAPSWVTPAIQGGLTLFGGLMANRAASDAVDAQLAATQQGYDFLRESRDIALERDQPFYDASIEALAGIRSMTGMSDQPYDITQDPSYQFRLDEGVRTYEDSAFATGGITGGMTEGLLRYAQDYASTEYDASYRRLLAIAGYGPGEGSSIVQNFGNSAANLALNAGEARGSGYIARGNTWQNTVDQLAQIDWSQLRRQ